MFFFTWDSCGEPRVRTTGIEQCQFECQFWAPAIHWLLWKGYFHFPSHSCRFTVAVLQTIDYVCLIFFLLFFFFWRVQSPHKLLSFHWTKHEFGFILLILNMIRLNSGADNWITEVYLSDVFCRPWSAVTVGCFVEEDVVFGCFVVFWVFLCFCLTVFHTVISIPCTFYLC